MKQGLEGSLVVHMLDQMARKMCGAIRRGRQSLRPHPDAYLKNCRSVVHVGANSGQERELYAKYDLDVVWIEPIPTVFDRLVKNITPYPKQQAVRALVADRDGDVRHLNVASNEGASSSIFDLALHKDVWPDISYVDRIEMVTSTLDTLLKKSDNTNIDAIILDTQGSELLVLRGGAEALARANYVKTECADFESYVGCATFDALSEFLRQRSYRLLRKDKFAEHPNGGAYFDVLFRKG